MFTHTLDVHGVPVPRFLYGTAWKEDDTARLVTQALEVGFIGIDTANQRKHYHEAGVGEALRGAKVRPFLQTKFTHRAGQDARLPYDPKAPLALQVRQSFESSLDHLGVDTIDSYVLHGPSTRSGWSAGDLEVWRAMEALHDEHQTKLLGVSNVSLEQLEALCARARVPPAMVQNRCYARFQWDGEVRAFCRQRGLVYQGFSLLTANAAELQRPAIADVARRLKRTPAQVVFRFALQVGMVCLTGSTSREHLLHDLACFDFELSDAEVRAIERVTSLPAGFEPAPRR
ncbi:MAG: aldo/keto reductase [Archangium sp.]|nr:aldo/keto reductase [Archangium sp.]